MKIQKEKNTKKRVRTKSKITKVFLFMILLFFVGTMAIFTKNMMKNSNALEEETMVAENVATARAATMSVPAGYVLEIDKKGDGAREIAPGSYTLLAGQTYYVEIAGGKGGDDSYGGGNGAIQHCKIVVGSSNVSLMYRVGGRGDWDVAGRPDGQKGASSGGGGGSTSVYLNGTLAFAAAGGGGGGDTSYGYGGTATGGRAGRLEPYNQKKGQKWTGDGTGVKGSVHYGCSTDGGGGGGGFPAGYNIYYHESGWTPNAQVYKDNYDRLGLTAEEKARWPFNLKSEEYNWKMVGDWGATGGTGYFNGSVAGCTITLLKSENGSYGFYEGERSAAHRARQSGNGSFNENGEYEFNSERLGDGYFRLYRQPFRVKFNITKTDSITGEKLSGAVFNVYEYMSNGTTLKKVATLTESPKGVYTSPEIEATTTLAKFRVVEDSSPSMYTNKNWYEDVTLTNAGLTTITRTVENEPYKAKARVVKVDSETGNKISGATFTVYSFNKASNSYIPYIQNGVTVTLARQLDGTYQTNGWLYYNATNEGRFRIVETGTPGGYVGDFKNIETRERNTYDINLTSENNGGIVTVSNSSDGTFKNQRVKGKISLNKIDKDSELQEAQGDATIDGATYALIAREDIIHPDGQGTVLYKAGTIIDTKATENGGKLEFTELYLGKYSIKEITPSTGYLLDTEVYDVDLIYEGEAKPLIERIVTSKEKVIKQPFTFSKGTVNSSELLPGHGTSMEILNNAGFSVYLLSDLSKVKDGTIVPDVDGNYNIDDIIKEYFNKETLVYDFSAESKAIVYNTNDEGGKLTNIDGNKHEVSELFSDKTGKVHSPELPYGKYLVVESTIPDNYPNEYFVAEPIIVTISEDSREEKLPDDNIFAVINYPFDAKLKVTKVDSVTKKAILKVGAAYKIYNLDKEEYVTQTISYPEYVTVGTDELPFRVTEQGWLMTPETLPVGHYRLDEVEAPFGYVLQGYETNPREKVEFYIRKESDYILDENDDKLYVVVTVNQENDPELGELTIEKNGEKVVEKRDNGITKLLRKVTGTEERISYNYEMGKVEGAEFEVYVSDTIYTPDNQKDESGNFIVNTYNGVRLEKDALVARVTTNEEGKAILKGLPLGKYYIKEVVAGKGYVLNKEVKEVEFVYAGQTIAVVSESREYTNERQKAEINVSKTSEITGEPLEGAEFGLYIREDDGENYKYILIEKAVTGKDGIATFEADIPLGVYYVKETNPPEGYITTDPMQVVEFTYTDQEIHKQVFNLEFEDELAKTPYKRVDIGDGVETEPGEILTYTVTYRNESNVNEKLRITDRVPDGTKYVKGYATASYRKSNKKVEGLNIFEPDDGSEGDFVVWESDTFELKPNETIIVSFKVRVKLVSEGLNIDKITNKAQVTHGENIDIFVKKGKYKIKYYKDSLVNGKLLGEYEFEAELGSTIDYNSIDKDLLKPEGYKNGEIQESVSAKIVTKDGENVVYILYESEKEEPEKPGKYIIKYYKDDINDENEIGSYELPGNIGENIPWDDINKNLLKPDGYEDGVLDEEISAKIIEENGENIVYIIYKKKIPEPKYGYMVKYYKDNVVTGEFLGEVFFEGNLGDKINYENINGNLLQPQDYNDGVILENISAKVIGKEENIVYVLYQKEEPEKPGKYVIKYYKDDVNDENEIGSFEVPGNIGDKIPWDDINKDLLKPEGYTNGKLDEEISAKIIEKDGENIVYIVYKKRDENKKGNYIVKYFKDTIDKKTLLGEESFEGEIGSVIDYDSIDTELKRPKDYTSGIIIEEISAIIVREGEENVIYILYKKLPITDETNKVENPITPVSKEVDVGNKMGIVAGEELTYTIVYRNATNTEETLKITDSIPVGTKYVGGSVTAEIDGKDAIEDGRIIVETLPDKADKGELIWKTTSNSRIKANEIVTVTFKVRAKTIDEGLSVNKITNVAKVEHNGKVETTNEVENPVSNQVKSVDVGNKTEVVVGSTLTYTLKYKNTSDEDEKVVITDNIPDGTSYIGGSMTAKIIENVADGITIKEVDNGARRGKIEWDIERLKPGEIIEVTFKVKVEDKDIGNVINIGEVEHTGLVSGKKIKEPTNEVENPVKEPYDIPNTGDDPNTSDINVWVYLILIFIAIIGIVISVRIIKRKEIKQKSKVTKNKK